MRPGPPPAEFELDTLAAEGARRRAIAALFPGAEPIPLCVGHYEVIDILGRGGMGVVYRAKDPRLNREVAIKRLLAWRRDRPDGRDSLLREAQQLAQLQHPNVVGVFDVGEHEGHPFVVMELVPGRTLSSWLRAQQRSASEISTMFRQAGEGIAAAHLAGILHLDFKPANVLVGPDGIPKVGDFGLAMFRDQQEEDATTQRANLGDTRAAPTAGTPAYMSPEQFNGRRTEAADQFAFGVALIEALFGAHPFERRPAFVVTEQEHRAAMRRTLRALPLRVRRVLRRAVALRPEDRWPSMRALLDALERAGPSTTAVALAVLCPLIVAAVVGSVPDRNTSVSNCSTNGSTARIAAKLRELDALHPQDERGLGYLKRQLDSYGHNWAQSHRAACALVEADPQASTSADTRFACLRGRQAELEAVVEQIASNPEAASQQPTALLGALGSLEACNKDGSGQYAVPPTTLEQQQRHAEARRQLTVANVREQLDDFRGAAELLAQAQPTVAELSDEALTATYLHRKGSLALSELRIVDAEEALTGAFFTAQRAGDDSLTTLAATDLAFLTGAEDPRSDHSAAHWLRQAEAARIRGGLVPSFSELTVRAAIALQDGDIDQALAHLSAASETLSTFDPVRAAKTLSNKALVLRRAGRLDEARSVLQSSLELHENELGSQHRLTARARVRLATTLRQLGELELAEELAQAAYGDLRGSNTKGELEACSALGLSQTQQARGQGCDVLDACVKLSSTLTGADHPATAHHQVNLAGCHREAGRIEEAEALLRAAVQTFAFASAPQLAFAQQGLADVLLQQARTTPPPGDASLQKEAVRLARGAVEMVTIQQGTDGVAIAGPTFTLGLALLESGQPELALAPLELSSARLTAADTLASRISARALALAVCRWTLGTDRAANLRAAHEAAAGLSPSVGNAWLLAWLRAHPA